MAYSLIADAAIKQHNKQRCFSLNSLLKWKVISCGSLPGFVRRSKWLPFSRQRDGQPLIRALAAAGVKIEFSGFLFRGQKCYEGPNAVVYTATEIQTKIDTQTKTEKLIVGNNTIFIQKIRVTVDTKLAQKLCGIKQKYSLA